MPGLTGWAQINGRDELPIPVKVEFEEYYLRNRSFLLDPQITQIREKRGTREHPQITQIARIMEW